MGLTDGGRDISGRQHSMRVKLDPGVVWELLDRLRVNRHEIVRLAWTSSEYLPQFMSKTHCRSAKLRERLENALGATYFEDLLILEVIS